MNFPTSAIFTNILISGTKGNNRRNGLVYEHILGKIKSPFENVQHSLCSRRLPKPHPTAYTKKKKKKILSTKTKKLLEDEV